MAALSKEDKLHLLRLMLDSRHADLREQNLNRQGKGHFHVSGMGHEALAAISIQTELDDYLGPYYRDRSLVLGRGMTTRELGLEYFAKRNTGSGGRQMPSHYSHSKLHIWSVPTPTGSQLLPACGIAWGLKLDGKKNLVVTTVGDAATRQGDFFEAICFAREKKLPMLFVVEDNAYGISSPTREINPVALGILPRNECRRDLPRRHGSIRGNPKWKRPDVFLGNDGAALQSHQLGRPKTLSQPGRIGRVRESRSDQIPERKIDGRRTVKRG